MKLLIVEPDRPLLLIMKTWLEYLNPDWDVSIANNAARIQEYFYGNRPDVVVMECWIDTAELCRTVTRCLETHRIKPYVIVYTDYKESERVALKSKLGADEVVYKTIDMHEVYDKLVEYSHKVG